MNEPGSNLGRRWGKSDINHLSYDTAALIQTMKNGVFWDVVPFVSRKNGRFGGT
jgi:hypothetical protein